MDSSPSSDHFRYGAWAGSTYKDAGQPGDPSADPENLPVAEVESGSEEALRDRSNRDADPGKPTCGTLNRPFGLRRRPVLQDRDDRHDEESSPEAKNSE